MEQIFSAGAPTDECSINRCRELLGDEAVILAFAERVLPSASNLWVQSSFAQKQRLQQVFFPDGIRFNGKKLVGTGTILPVFNYLSRFRMRKKGWWTSRESNRWWRSRNLFRDAEGQQDISAHAVAELRIT